MSRVTHNVAELNKHQVFSKCDTIITFRNQQLLDLWINEMQGQISDGMWENSRGTEWLWKDAWLQLGDETRVEVRYSYRPGGMRKTYPLTKELWDIVGDRIMDESGFASKREAYAAWREIYDAIKNAQDLRPETKAAFETEAKAVARKSQDVAKRMTDEWIEAGYKIEEYKYSWSNDVCKRRETIYLRPDTKKGYLSVDTSISEDGTQGWWKISYNNSAFRIPAGHLQEGLAKIRNFFRDWEDWTEGLKKNN